MAAIVVPQPESAPSRPHLTLIEGGRDRMVLVYRRRRLVAALVLILVAVSATVAVRTLLQPASPPASHSALVAPAATLVVQPGDTLWSIARRIQPTGDIRPLVDRLSELAGPGPLESGELLTLPR